MIDNPVFSIITPVYNAAHTLTRCASSIFEQSFAEWEWLLVDDGSIDDSWTCMEGLATKDSRVHLFQQKNSGPSVARNLGLNNAQGEYVLFMDADDYYPDSNVLKCLVEAIKQHIGVDMIYFSGNVVLSDGKVYNSNYTTRVFDRGCDCIEAYCCQPLSIVFGALYSQCYRRSLITQSDIAFNNDIVYGEDRLFVISCFMKAKKTVVLSMPLYNYVVTEGSLMNDAIRKKRQAEDGRKVAYELEKLLSIGNIMMPHLRKYLHGMYVKSIDGLKRSEIDWKFVFRNASSWKLKIKDVLLFLGVNLY